MRNCLNPVCGLEILEDATCGCGWDNSASATLAAEGAAEEFRAEETAVFAAVTGNPVLAMEARIEEEEAILDEEAAAFDEVVF